MGDFQGHPFRGNQWSDGGGAGGAGGATLSRGDYMGNIGTAKAGVPFTGRIGNHEVTGTGQGLRPAEATPVHEDPKGDARIVAEGKTQGVDVVPDGDGVPLEQRLREGADVISEDVGPYGSNEGSRYQEHTLPSAKGREYQGPEGQVIKSIPLERLKPGEGAAVEAARMAVGNFSGPAKMPCLSWSIPPSQCKVGAVLAQIPGTSCDICYAKKGRYVMDNVAEAMQRRYDTWKSMPDQEFVDNFAKGLKGQRYFRWFDAGDVQGERMLNQIVKIAQQTPDVQHWLPTKEAMLVDKWQKSHPEGWPKNLQVRVSLPLVGVDPAKLPRKDPSRQLPRAGIVKTGASCPASNQGGACGRCRRCWSNQDVTYKQH